MSELDERNARNYDAWRHAWALQGGRPMSDLRNQEQLRQYRVIEFKRWQTGKVKRRRGNVVNLAAWYLRRARNGRRPAIA
jgi:hypothetical protein